MSRGTMCLLSIFVASASFAQGPPAGNPNAIAISSATVDFAAMKIHITGTNFCTSPAVTLGTASLVVSAANATTIDAALPADIAAGTYVLKVGCSQVQTATLDMTIGAPPQVVPDSLAVTVNCPTDSIQAALARPAKSLTINIHGVCTEDVYIGRNNVTLHGSDPALDGLHGTGSTTETAYGLVRVQHASSVTIENLTISDSNRWGINVFGSNAVNVKNCNLLRNSRDGIAVQLGAANVSGGTFDGNGRSAIAGFGADLLQVAGVTASNSNYGVIVINSRATVDSSNLSARFDAADVEEEADLSVKGTTITGSLYVSTNSELWAENMTQTAITPSSPNWIEIDSSVLLNSGAVLAGETRAYAFSKVALLNDSGTTGAQIQGQLRCFSASEVFMVPGTSATGGVSGCSGTTSSAAAVTPDASERRERERGHMRPTP